MVETDTLPTAGLRAALLAALDQLAVIDAETVRLQAAREAGRAVSQPAGPLLLTIEQVCAATGLPESRIRRALRSRDLPSIKEGTKERFIARTDLETWIAGLPREAAPARPVLMRRAR